MMTGIITAIGGALVGIVGAITYAKRERRKQEHKHKLELEKIRKKGLVVSVNTSSIRADAKK